MGEPQGLVDGADRDRALRARPQFRRGAARRDDLRDHQPALDQPVGGDGRVAARLAVELGAAESVQLDDGGAARGVARAADLIARSDPATYAQIGRAHVELQSLMRISYDVS